MAIIVKNFGLDTEAVVGSYCQGSLEVEGKRLPLGSLETLKHMGYTVLYIQ